MAAAESTKTQRRVTLKYPANWDRLTDEEKVAAARGMAEELRNSLKK